MYCTTCGHRVIARSSHKSPLKLYKLIIRRMPTKWSYCIFCAYYAPLSNHGAFQLFSLLNLFVGEPIVGLQGKGENLPEKNPKGPNITLHGVPGSIRVILDQWLGLENHIRAWYLQKTQLKNQLYEKCIRFKFFQMSGKGLRGALYSWWRCVIDNSGLLLRRHVFHFRKDLLVDNIFWEDQRRRRRRVEQV